MHSVHERSLETSFLDASSAHTPVPSDQPGDTDTGPRGDASGTACMILTPCGCISP